MNERLSQITLWILCENMKKITQKCINRYVFMCMIDHLKIKFVKLIITMEVKTTLILMTEIIIQAFY